jgi:hypothetical protein
MQPRARASRSSVHILAVAHFHDVHEEFVVIDSKDNPIDTLSDAVSVLSRQLLTPLRPGVVRQLFDLSDNLLSVLLAGNRLEFLEC